MQSPNCIKIEKSVLPILKNTVRSDGVLFLWEKVYQI